MNGAFGALVTTRIRVAAVFVTCAALVTGLAPSAYAGGAHSLFIMDANTGAVLTDQDGNDPRYPASLTKMMTLYLVFEQLEKGRLSMKTRVPISAHAANAAPSKLELAVGDEITVEDAMLALITKSANDVAIALAEQVGGTEPEFAKLMTAKAHAIGMKSTTFRNASGLPDSGQTTTARDMVTLGVRLYDDFPRYFPMFSTRAHTYNGSTHKNHNTLMLQMPGINGIKTGYTHASGFNLVSSLQQDGKHLVGAIFGGETAGSRNAQMRVSLTRALARASTAKTRKPVLAAGVQPAKKPKPTAAVVAAVAPKPAPVPAAPAQAVVVAPPVQVAAAVPAPTGALPLKIDVARVRPVGVAEAKAPASPIAQAAMALRLSDVFGHKPAPASPSTPAAAAQISHLAAQPSPLPAPVVQPGVAVAPAAAVSPAPGRPPSSLNAQLAQLEPASAKMVEPSYRLKGPANAAGAAVVPVVATAGAFEIQIGAYASAAEADKRLATAKTQVPLLAQRAPVRRVVSVGDKTLYRARFGGFDAASAHAACAELNKQAINCLAVKSE